MTEPSGPSEDSGETRALMLVAQALQAATAESRTKYTVHNTILLWFMGASILCHVTQIGVMVSFMPSRIARELSVSQNQNVNVEPDRNDLGKLTRARMEELGQLRGIPQ